MRPDLLVSTVLLMTKAVQAAGCLDVAVAETPPCALACFFGNDPSSECDGYDFTCRCQKEAMLYAAIEPCVASGCPEDSFQAVIDGASSVCNCATAFPGGLAIENPPGSFAVATAVADSNTILNTVVGAVPGTVADSATGSAIGTVISSPTTTDTTRTPATSGPSQNAVLSYRNDLRFNLVTNVAVQVLLATLW